MFNYICNEKPSNKPMTPIEKKVSMPTGMQPIPQIDPNVTCVYPDMDIMPMAPDMMPMVPNTAPQAMPMPCMYCGMTHQPMPMTPNMPTSNPSCDLSKNQDDMEVAYIKKMYPPLCKKIQTYVEGELNQYDHDLSPIYEMYPSPQTIQHMANCIYTNMKADMATLIKEFEGNPNLRSPMGGSFYTLVYVMLLNELYRKRMRRRLYR